MKKKNLYRRDAEYAERHSNFDAVSALSPRLRLNPFFEWEEHG
jgi:hypothetical protein